MTHPADIHHGTLTGYSKGCRQDCCRRARRLHETQRRRDADKGIRYTVPAIGTQRRFRALMRLGWTSQHIGDRIGWTADHVQIILIQRKQVNRRTAEKVAAAYDEMCMTLGPSKITRSRAERNGWPPPLAWDDIDDPAEQPVTVSAPRSHTDVDEAVVERVLAGEKLPATRAEKDEIVRRWRAQGRLLADLERITGWKIERYARGEAA